MTQTGARRVDMRAMGTTLSVYGPLDASIDAVPAVATVFQREEQRFSRFLPGSELSQVNRSAGTWTSVSEGFRSLLRYSLEKAAVSGGTFDPTVLRAVEAAGYDRDLDEVLRAARGVLHPPVPCGRWSHIEVRGRQVRAPSGVGLDFGGIAKGWTVDLAVDTALSAGLPWVLVSAGGDLRIGGDAPMLAIDVEDPEHPAATIATLRLQEGGLATSSTTRRSWGPGLHHVIDPRTGAPARSDACQVTTWGPTCADAEVAATVSLIEGTRAVDDVPSVIVGIDGAVYVSFAADGEAA